MNKFLTILRNQKSITLFLIIGYFSILLFFHQSAGELFAELVDSITRKKSDNILFVFFLFIFFVYLIKLFSNKVRINKRQLIFLLPTFIISFYTFFCLFVNNIELIHFAQYALLTLLIFPLSNRVGSAIFLSSFFGIMDEAFQYYNTYNELRPTLGYFDFNDVIANILGSAFMGIMLIPFNSSKVHYREFFCLKELRFLFIIIVFLIIFLFIDFISFFNSDAIIILNQQISKEESFFTIVPPGVVYHIIKPLEGIIFVILLLLFYFMIDLKPNFALSNEK